MYDQNVDLKQDNVFMASELKRLEDVLYQERVTNNIKNNKK